MKKLFIVLILFLVGCSQQMDSIGSPPPVSVEIGDSQYSMKLGSYSWTKEGLFSSATAVADAPSPNQLAENMEPVYVESASEVNINTKDNPSLSVYLWKEDNKDKEVPLDGTKFHVPEDAGRYIYEVFAQWNAGEGSYTIVIEVE